MRWTQVVSEDTAGNKYFAEFEPGCTAPVKQWVERAVERVQIGSVMGSPVFETRYLYELQYSQDCPYTVHEIVHQTVIDTEV